MWKRFMQFNQNRWLEDDHSSGEENFFFRKQKERKKEFE